MVRGGALQARFGLVGLKDEAFPRIKLFRKGQDTAKPVDYSASMKDSSELLAWTVAKTGVFVGVKVRSQPTVRVEAQSSTRAAHLCAHMCWRHPPGLPVLPCAASCGSAVHTAAELEEGCQPASQTRGSPGPHSRACGVKERLEFSLSGVFQSLCSAQPSCRRFAASVHRLRGR